MHLSMYCLLLQGNGGDKTQPKFNANRNSSKNFQHLKPYRSTQRSKQCEFADQPLKENSSFKLGSMKVSSLIGTIYPIVYHCIEQFSDQVFS